MANYTESFAAKLDWAMPFQRTSNAPLDRTDLFSSKADAEKYAAGNPADPDSRKLCGTSYVGQLIVVFENDVVTPYIIGADRTLQEIKGTAGGEGGSEPTADDNTSVNFGKEGDVAADDMIEDTLYFVELSNGETVLNPDDLDMDITEP